MHGGMANPDSCISFRFTGGMPYRMTVLFSISCFNPLNLL
jgi:hypothetical protein